MAIETGQFFRADRQMSVRAVALSLKQPWAALVVAGLKSIEIRRWATNRVGPIYVHAAKVDDPRHEAWRWVPPEWEPLTELRGGLIGTIDLTGCVKYEDRQSFAADRMLHLNTPDWFRPPALYGFTMVRPQVIEFRPAIGNIKFFPVP